jgi:hypothetical protein
MRSLGDLRIPGPRATGGGVGALVAAWTSTVPRIPMEVSSSPQVLPQVALRPNHVEGRLI